MKSVAVAQTTATAAEKSANVAEATLIQTERPWVAVDIDAAGPLTYDDYGLTIRISFTLKNVGRSPAMYATIGMIAFINKKGVAHAFDPVSRQEKIIEKLRRYSPGEGKPQQEVSWHVIFPDSQAIIHRQYTILKRRLDDAKDDCGKINLVVVGAIGYRFSFGSTVVHVTGFCYDVHRSDRPRPVSVEKNREPSAIFPDEGDIPEEDLRFTASTLGGVNHAD